MSLEKLLLTRISYSDHTIIIIMTIQKIKYVRTILAWCHRFCPPFTENRYEKEKRRLYFTYLYVNTSLIDVLKFWFLKLILLKFHQVLKNFFCGCCEDFWFHDEINDIFWITSMCDLIIYDFQKLFDEIKYNKK